MTDINKIIAERTKSCGNFKDITETAQTIKRALRDGSKYFNTAPYLAEALDMIAHKLARIVDGNPYHKDHWLDIIGYAELVLREIQKPDNLFTNGTLTDFDSDHSTISFT